MQKHGRAHNLDVVRVILINSLVLYHNLRIFQGPINYNQIVIKPPADWHPGSPERDAVELTWKQIAKTQRVLLQAGLNLFFLLAGCAAYLSLSGRRNILAFLGERLNKLVLACIFGVFFLAVPSNYLISLCRKKTHFDFFGFLEFMTTGKAYEPGHLSFAPYLFFITVMLMPHFLFILRIVNSKKRILHDDHHNDDVEEGGSGVTNNHGYYGHYSLNDRRKPYILAAAFGLYALVFAWTALWHSSLCWLLVCACVWMTGWTLQSPLLFQEKLSDISNTLLLNTIVVTLLAFYMNSQGGVGGFFLHPFGVGLIFLTLMIVPLAPSRIELQWALGHNTAQQSTTTTTTTTTTTPTTTLNLPLIAIALVIAAHLFCLTYPERLLMSKNVIYNCNPLPSWLTSSEWNISERTLYSFAFMLIGHSSMFIAGFLKMSFESELPPLPLNTLSNMLLLMSLVVYFIPQTLNSDPEGWEFLNPGYVAYDYTRFHRFNYAVGTWFVNWVAVLFAKIGTNDFSRRPWLTWIRDCSFGVFFCHVFWEGVISYFLIVDSWLSQLDWFHKIIILNVTVYLCSYGWCWAIGKIPFIRATTEKKRAASPFIAT